MDMIVNHQITLSGDNNISTRKDSANTGHNIDDIMFDLSDIILEMNKLDNQRRDMMSAYNQKQQMLGWDIQVSSMQNKRDAIDKTARGAIVSSACTLVSGVVGIAGAAVSLKLGDIATHGSSALGQITSGGGKLAEGVYAREADLQRMISDLQGSNAQSYNKNISELSDKISELRQNMKDLSNNISSMMGQIAIAAKL
ncbi:TPA: chemotaxis protein [Yersinia enterocolitica]|nr:chemotaxis protein [Yersinia enterocolitica]